MLKLIAFWRLSRPFFLLGGISLFALGAVLARSQGYTIDPVAYIVGQLCVTTLQLMTQYLNEYWDFEADRLNTSRTRYSGGSGVLVEGLLPRQTAMIAGILSLVISVLLAALLLANHGSSVWVIGLVTLSFLGAYFYSSPPLALATTGLGELTASVIVAGCVPALTLLLFGGRFTVEVALIVFPLIVIHFAMLLAFEFPDEHSDRLAGKRTLVVRLGRQRAARLHNGCLMATIAVGLVGAATVLPPQTAILTLVLSPLAVWQMRAVALAAQGHHPSQQGLPFTAVAILALVTVSVTLALFSQRPMVIDI